nr:benzoate/H(+) symporter BenE family transporter [Cryobacterium sp. TMT3-29-2]
MAAITGFASSFVLVIAGLQAVGATDDQAASGLLALCLLVGITCVMLPWYFKMPISFAWSTPPGAALLVAAGQTMGDFGAAAGAFLVCGALIVLSGLWTLDSGRRWGGPSPSAVW